MELFEKFADKLLEEFPNWNEEIPDRTSEVTTSHGNFCRKCQRTPEGFFNSFLQSFLKKNPFFPKLALLRRD